MEENRNYVILNGERVELSSTNPSGDKSEKQKAPKRRSGRALKIFIILSSVIMIIAVVSVVIMPRHTLSLIDQAYALVKAGNAESITKEQLEEIKISRMFSLINRENFDWLIADLEKEVESARNETVKTAESVHYKDMDAAPTGEMFAPNDDPGPGPFTEAQLRGEMEATAYFGSEVHVIETVDTYYFIVPKDWQPTAFLSSKLGNKQVTLCRGYTPSLCSDDLASYNDYVELSSLLPYPNPTPPAEPTTTPTPEG